MIKVLNGLSGEEGFIWREYSPASKRFQLNERRYFTEENAKKVDAISAKIHHWKDEKTISHKEFVLLMSDLIQAVNNVSIPARNKEWQPAYDLSFDIVKGLGSSYDAERFVAPGFVVDTWQLWEWLVTTGMRIGNTKHTILPQNSVRWGYKEAYSGKYSVNVFPDIEVVTKDSQLTPLYLLDAKYKLVKNATTGEVERDDLYEAFAFCSATDTNEIVLVYPADDPANIPGHVKKCSTYYVKDVMIHVVQVAFGSIKEKGGIYAFSANLCSGIEAVLKSS